MAKYPWQSPYAAFNNNPIFFIDPLGLEGEKPGDKDKENGTWTNPNSGISYTYDKEGDFWYNPNNEVTVTGYKRAEHFNNIDLDKLTKDDYPYYMYVPSNTFTYNTINNWYGFNSRSMGYDPNKIVNLSEERKQNMMQNGPRSTLLILMAEFMTGTGPEIRRFGPNDPITQALMESYTIARGYAVIRDRLKNGTLADGQTIKIGIPYSPDNAGAMNSIGYHMQSLKSNNIIEFSRGSVTMFATRNGEGVQIKIVDSYTITSANFMFRAQTMAGGAGGYIENISRREGEYLPMSTTTQEFNWFIPFKDFITDY